MTDPAPLAEQIETAAGWIAASHHLVVFTGAGISTDSGLPDFRGPDGVWTRRDKGLPPPRRTAAVIRPNAAHLALARLAEAGRLTFLISQNVDGLHLESGIPPERLAELHGNGGLMRCLACDRQFPLARCGWDRRRFGEGYRTSPPRADQPPCPACGGRLISSVVNFGDPLPQPELDAAQEHSRRADCFWVIGSSLVVTPAADLPALALDAGARLMLCNRGETPFDARAHLHLTAGIGETVPPIVDRALALAGRDG